MLGWHLPTLPSEEQKAKVGQLFSNLFGLLLQNSLKLVTEPGLLGSMKLLPCCWHLFLFKSSPLHLCKLYCWIWPLRFLDRFGDLQEAVVLFSVLAWLGLAYLVYLLPFHFKYPVAFTVIDFFFVALIRQFGMEILQKSCAHLYSIELKQVFVENTQFEHLSWH